jgi:hypothetical protein
MFSRTPLRVYLVAIVVPSAVLIVGLLSGIPPRVLLRDPIIAAGGGPADEFYYGIYGVFSNLGVILWCVAATVSLFSLSVYTHASPQTKSFLLYSGFLSVILTLDDLFVVHENFGSVPVYIFYAFAIAFYLYRFAALVLNRLDAGLLLLCLGLFATSVITDTVIDLRPGNIVQIDLEQVRAQVEAAGVPAVVEATGGSFRLRTLAEVIEDGAKFLGIACWAAFHVRAAWLLRHDR